MAYNVFICHSIKDRAIAEKIVKAIECKGVNCWYAERDMQSEDSWIKGVMEKIANCDLFLILLTEWANKSKHVKRECMTADKHNKSIIPINYSPSNIIDSLDEVLCYLTLMPHWEEINDEEYSYELLAERILTKIKGSDCKKNGKKTNGNRVAEQASSKNNFEEFVTFKSVKVYNDTIWQTGRSFPAIAQNPSIAIGTKIGPWKITQFIATGNLTIVFKATAIKTGNVTFNETFNEDVCIKFHQPFIHNSKEYLGRALEQERERTFSLKHKSICTTLDYGLCTYNNAIGFFVVTEYISGELLPRWLETQPETIEIYRARLKVIWQITRAIAFAHSPEIYANEKSFLAIPHGNVQLKSIMVRPDNSAMLLNFSLIEVNRMRFEEHHTPNLSFHRDLQAIARATGINLKMQTNRYITLNQPSDIDSYIEPTCPKDLIDLGWTFLNVFVDEKNIDSSYLIQETIAGRSSAAQLLHLIFSLIGNEVDSADTVLNKLKIILQGEGVDVSGDEFLGSLAPQEFHDFRESIRISLKPYESEMDTRSTFCDSEITNNNSRQYNFESEIKKTRAAAENFIKKGHIDNAICHLEIIDQINQQAGITNDFTTLKQIGDLLYEKHDYNGSIAYYKKLKDSCLNDPIWMMKAHYALGNAYCKIQRFIDAGSEFLHMQLGAQYIYDYKMEALSMLRRADVNFEVEEFESAMNLIDSANLIIKQHQLTKLEIISEELRARLPCHFHPQFEDRKSETIPSTNKNYSHSIKRLFGNAVTYLGKTKVLKGIVAIVFFIVLAFAGFLLLPKKISMKPVPKNLTDTIAMPFKDSIQGVDPQTKYSIEDDEELQKLQNILGNIGKPHKQLQPKSKNIQQDSIKFYIDAADKLYHSDHFNLARQTYQFVVDSFPYYGDIDIIIKKIKSMDSLCSEIRN